MPPSPTKHTRPQVRALRTAARPRVGVAGAVHGGVRALAVGEVADGRTGSVSLELITASAPKSRASLRRSGDDVDRDHPRAHGHAQHRAAEPTGPWPKTARVSRPGDVEPLSAP